jgi:GDPmannose 4,6-dehydratase
LQQDKPAEYLVAKGETHTEQEFSEVAFARVGLDPKKHVAFDERYLRPAEVDLLIKDASKAKKMLGWKPKVKFKQPAEIMVDADIQLLKETMGGRTIRL